MVTKYQKFGDGYKAEAVKLYRESNQTIAETARNLGLKESTLANWVKKDKENEAVAVGEDGFSGNREVCVMQDAGTVLEVLRDRGRKSPVANAA